MTELRVRWRMTGAIAAAIAAAMAAVGVLSGCDPDDGSSGFSTGEFASSSNGGTPSDSGTPTDTGSPPDSGTAEPDAALQSDGSSEGDASIQADTTIAECTGVSELASTRDAPTAGEAPECAVEAGCAAPSWWLDDFQPQSCGFESIYGLDSFQGRPTLVVLLAAWCPFCRAQIEKIEQLRFELMADDVQVNFAVVNMANAADLQFEFTDRVGFPLFQDTEDVDAYGLHAGGKDDVYLYDAAGLLIGYYKVSAAEFSLDLSTEEGYANLDGLLREVAGAH